MKGCRPLTNSEIESLLEYLSRFRHCVRDRTLLLVGLRTGFRISELLSLRVSNVMQNGKIAGRVWVARRHMKGKKEGRELVLHPEAKAALEQLIPTLDPGHDPFLFQAQGAGGRPLNRRRAWQVLKKAAAACGLEGKLATHSMRKTFAHRVHERGGKDLRKTQEAMGHKNINSTAAYIGVDQDEVDDLILKS